MLNTNLIRIKSKLMHFEFFEKRILKAEGGEKESQTLRYKVSKNFNVQVGMYTYGSCFDAGFNLGGVVDIGRYCSFAKDVHFFGANHPLNYISMSPYFYNKGFGYEVKDVERSKLVIGNDVWVGHGVLITSKCTHIGNGAVIGAGSVVTHDVPAYAVVAGNPAKIIKYRFSSEIIEKIEKSEWWNMTPQRIMNGYQYIDKPLEFIDFIQNTKIL